MGLESATYIGGLSTSNPVSSDGVSQGDDHLRLIKNVLQATFPNATKEFYFPGATAKTADFSVATTDDNEIFPCDASSAQITVTLPLGSNLNDGFQCIIFKTDASNDVVVQRNGGGSDTINGATSVTLNTQYEFLWVFWTGSEWLAVTPHPESTLTTRGDLLTADASGDESRLAIGSSGEYLRSDGSDPAWSSILAADLPTASTTAQGAVEESTTGELTSATDGKFPDSETIWNEMGGVLESEKSLSSGSSVTFTGISSKAKRVILMFKQMTQTSDGAEIRVGSSGGVESSGYESGSFRQDFESSSTSGFKIHPPDFSGRVVLEKYDESTIVSNHGGFNQSSTDAYAGGGIKTGLSGTLDRVQIVSGGNFNGGSVTIRVEYGA